ncbi:hypothetical protein BOTBODRAFT_265112 [Botryobasidium botryosum FD-172 SS1]|uniref:Uncharacterized protein n=1 Tax=Botryobasidium botryosum (strain FD-172 SS1) TaxID=930990 RepID=A0A067M2N1_BOTB1|nr:hypothetical protein BOTBODRAFT_265112 [Botryobasidium botryosum FD-172 SS1]
MKLPESHSQRGLNLFKLAKAADLCGARLRSVHISSSHAPLRKQPKALEDVRAQRTGRRGESTRAASPRGQRLGKSA